MKLLDGTELAGYIQERQAKQVRNIRQTYKVAPHLAIVVSVESPVTETYLRMKQLYGQDILVDVSVHRPTGTELLAVIEQLNNDPAVHGIIVQLPLSDPSQQAAALQLVATAKDVDGLAESDTFTPATAMAIDWLARGYNIELKGRKIAIVGNGQLVGAPLAKLWNGAGYNVTVFDEHSKNMHKSLHRYNVVVTAAGVPGLISSQQIQPNAVVIDAATTAEHGKLRGDVADDVRQRRDLTITPVKGGVGPLTVAALFDNVIRAARTVAEQTVA